GGGGWLLRGVGRRGRRQRGGREGRRGVRGTVQGGRGRGGVLVVLRLRRRGRRGRPRQRPVQPPLRSVLTRCGVSPVTVLSTERSGRWGPCRQASPPPTRLPPAPGLRAGVEAVPPARGNSRCRGPARSRPANAARDRRGVAVARPAWPAPERAAHGTPAPRARCPCACSPPA